MSCSSYVHALQRTKLCYKHDTPAESSCKQAKYFKSSDQRNMWIIWILIYPSICSAQVRSYYGVG